MTEEPSVFSRVPTSPEDRAVGDAVRAAVRLSWLRPDAITRKDLQTAHTRRVEREIREALHDTRTG